MRVVGLIGLVLALVAVGLLVGKQLHGAASAPSTGAQAQSQQVQQEFKQALDAAMQQPRPLPDDH
jgi:Na+-transporting methylmalonyl-CoA/oxaloacetate decarboxylase gamma subunit